MSKHFKHVLFFLLSALAVSACSISSTSDEVPVSADSTRIDHLVMLPDTQPDPVRIASYVSGATDGRPVIFIHGTPGSAGAWRQTIEQAPEKYRTIAIDRPGFGASGPDGAVTSLRDQARALLPLLHPVDGKKPILVGHSLGGPVVARAALDFTDRIGGVIFLAGAFDPDLEKVYAIQYLGDSFLLSWVLNRELRNANRELIALEKELKTLRDDLPQLAIPSIMIHGTDDDLVPYDNVAFMRSVLPEAAPFELVRLDGANHFLPWNAISTLWDAVERLDARLSRTEDAHDIATSTISPVAPAQ